MTSHQTESPMSELIARLEKATGASRTLDLEISVAINFKGVFAEYHDWHWNAGGDEIEAPYIGRKGRPAKAFLDPSQFVPRWTHSIDAALTLVPEGWRSGFEDGGKFDSNVLVEAWCWPFESSFEPDWMNGDEGYRSAPDGHRAAHHSRAIAICIAALKARTHKTQIE